MRLELASDFDDKHSVNNEVAVLVRCYYGRVIFFTSQTGKRLSVLRGHSRPIKCMLLLHQRQEYQNEEIAATLLLTGSSDRTILVSLITVLLRACLHYGRLIQALGSF